MVEIEINDFIKNEIALYLKQTQRGNFVRDLFLKSNTALNRLFLGVKNSLYNLMRENNLPISIESIKTIFDQKLIKEISGELYSKIIKEENNYESLRKTK